MTQALNRIIRRTMQNEARRSTQKLYQNGLANVRAGYVTSPTSVVIAGQHVPAAVSAAAVGSVIAVRNAGRPANALYVPTTAGGLVVAAAGGRSSSGSGSGGGASTLNELTDVTITAPSNAQFLSFDSASGQWKNLSVAPGMAAHDLSGSYHIGQLNWSLINFTGSNLTSIATRRHVDLQGITPNDHHNQVHLLASNSGLGPDHTISGALAGYVLRASSPTTANFQQLNHNDLTGITANQHHNQVHSITGTDHTIAGNTWDLVGAIGVNLLGLITPSFAPGAAAAILRTDANGGIQLDGNLLYVDAANGWVGFNKVPSGAAVDIQAAATAQISQRIKQIAGQTGRLWRIEDSAGNELIVLDSVGNLQSGRPGFVSGLTGWQITPGGNAEFNNIWARGELHATVFVKDEVHATGGTFLVATAGSLYADATINSTALDTDDLCVVSTSAGNMVALQIQTTSATFVGTSLKVEYLGNQLWINDPPSGPASYFQPGEIIRVKTEVPTGITDFWFEVQGFTQDSGFGRYPVIKRSGTDGTIPKGAAIVSYGKPGDGRILMTSDWRSDEGYTPYIDVFTTGLHPWDANDPSAIIPRMRMGQLKGVGVQGVSGISQWGMIASDDLTDTNAGYLIASNLGIKLYKVPLYLNNGVTNTGYWGADGTLKAGKNIDATATTGFSFDPATGNVIIGDSSPGSLNYLKWDQQAGTLYVVGALNIGQPSAPATLADVTAGDNNTLAAANSYTDSGLGTNRTYANQRRVLKATGTWQASSTPAQAPTTVVWSSVTLYLGDGTSKAVNNGSVVTGAMGSATARKFLYADVTANAPLTLIAVDSSQAVSNLNYVLIAVCDAGNIAASVSVVAGTTYISGSNIYTGSITANEIQANAITASKILSGEVHAYHLDSDVFTTAGGAGAYRAMAISGVIQADTTAGRGAYVRWTGLSVRKADGTTVAIADSSGYPAYGVQLTGRTFFYISPTATGSTTMTATTSAASIPAGYILIAVCEPQTNGANVVMYAGGVVISGDNILAGSITSSKVATEVFTVSGGYRSLAVSGRITPSGSAGNIITWSGLSVTKADGTTIDIADRATAFTLTARTWLYILPTATNGVIMSYVTDASLLPANAILIAVCDPGAVRANVIMVNGGVWISGDQIIAQSIVGSNIAAQAITADKMRVNDLSAMKGNFSGVNTGALTVNGVLTLNTLGSVRTSGKDSALDTTPGFFLGASGSVYQFGVGNNVDYITWDGSKLSIGTSVPIVINGDADGNFIQVRTPGTPTDLLLAYDGNPGFLQVSAPINVQGYGYFNDYVFSPRFTGDTIRLGVLSSVGYQSGVLNFVGNNGSAVTWADFDANNLNVAFKDTLSANSLIGQFLTVTGQKLRIATESTINFTGSLSSPAGNVGDIVWKQGFLYVYTGSSNGWRRVTLNSF